MELEFMRLLKIFKDSKIKKLLDFYVMESV